MPVLVPDQVANPTPAKQIEMLVACITHNSTSVYTILHIIMFGEVLPYAGYSSSSSSLSFFSSSFSIFFIPLDMSSVVPHKVAATISIRQNDMASFAHRYTPCNTIHLLLFICEVFLSGNNNSSPKSRHVSVCV